MAQPVPGKLAPLWALFRRLESLSVAMAYLGGLILTLLAFFIAFDVIGRHFSWFYSGATDEISGFAMSMAVTWALAYTLTIDKHVRVDIVLGMVSEKTRLFLDWVALGLLTLFAGLLAINSWVLALDSYDISAFSPSILQVPLVIPQGIMALGFTALAIQGVVAWLLATFDPAGLKRAMARDSEAAPTQFDI
jgi:TRAP-type mannitol/chloroaromatic compound transport system permease small subunit